MFGTETTSHAQVQNGRFKTNHALCAYLCRFWIMYMILLHTKSQIKKNTKKRWLNCSFDVIRFSGCGTLYFDLFIQHGIWICSRVNRNLNKQECWFGFSVVSRITNILKRKNAKGVYLKGLVTATYFAIHFYLPKL